MKILRYVTISAAAIMLTARVGTAQEVVHVWEDPNTWWGHHFVYTTAAQFYTAQELSFDLFGTYWAGQRGIEDLFETDIRHGVWGGGIGFNYFITREFGIGVDANIPDNGGNLFDTVMAHGIFRFPIAESGFAPYIFGGGGRSTDQVWQWLAHGGIGFEQRLNPITGIFIDSRYIWADRSSDSILFRAGLRFVF